MGDCVDKLSNNCGGKKVSAKCVDTQSVSPPEGSSLVNDSCINMNEAVIDIYALLGKILPALNTTDLDKFCLTVGTNDSGEITQRELNIAILTKLCETTTTEETTTTVDPNDIDLSKCNLDYGDLVDICGESITTICQLLQALIQSANTVATLSTTVATLQNTVTDLEATISDHETRITTLEN